MLSIVIPTITGREYSLNRCVSAYAQTMPIVSELVLVHDGIINRTDKRGFPVPFVEWAQREPVKSFIAERIGYTPDPAKPWDRQWWLDLCEASYVPA